jgi:hypothetical protein
MVMRFAAQRVERLEQFGDDLRRQAQRRFVEQQHARLGHQAAGDRQHLLLAAGQQAGALLQPLAQAREARSMSSTCASRPAGCRNAPRRRLSAPIVPGTPGGPRAPAPGRAARCARRQRRRVRARPGGCRPDRAMQAGQRAHQGRLAGAVGAQQRDEFAGAHLQVDAVQHGPAP